MKFVFPEFLYALFLIAIPVIIHLFNFRRYKKVYFPSIKFLKEVKQETASASKLKHLLVLLTRILALTFLVFAFAQPYLPSTKNELVGAENAISIYLDNSFSMDAIGKNGSLLEEAKSKTKEIISAFKNSDKFQLITNSNNVGEQKFYTKEEAIEQVNSVELNNNFSEFESVIKKQNYALSSYTSKRAFIVSDFQKSFFSLQKSLYDSSVQYVFVPIKAEESENIYIDSCWLESPIVKLNKVQKLVVIIKNTSSKTIENIPIKLFINNEQKATSSISIQAESEIKAELPFSINSKGVKQCKIEIKDYPVTFDDSFFFSFTVANKINILCISDTVNFSANKENLNEPFYALFNSDSLFNFSVAATNKINYSELQQNQLIILNQVYFISEGLTRELGVFASNGGTVVLIPNNTIDKKSYDNLANKLSVEKYINLDTTRYNVDKINYDHPLFKEVFDVKELKKEITINLPFVKNHYTVNTVIKSTNNTLLSLSNNKPFLIEYLNNSGKIYLLTSPLAKQTSNFSQHALFVPVFYNIASNSILQQKLYYILQPSLSIALPASSNTFTSEPIIHLKNTDNTVDIIPELKRQYYTSTLFLHNQLSESGNYMAYQEDTTICPLSFNYNRKESITSYFTKEEIDELLTKANWKNYKITAADNINLSKELSNLGIGKKLWKLCITLVLVFLALEIILLRIFK